MAFGVKLVAFLPISRGLRGEIYKLIYNHKTNSKIGRNFRIGFGSYIDSNYVLISDNCDIGNLVRIKFLDLFKLGEETTIGSSTIICGAYECNKYGNRNFVCGSRVEILCAHYFDVVAPVNIGNDVVVAGKWTQFYTHSFDLNGDRVDGTISVGNNVYIGAGCIINLGVDITNQVVLQAGTVVNKDINESGVYSSNEFYKRGSIREYNQIFRNHESKKLEKSGKTVWSLR